MTVLGSTRRRERKKKQQDESERPPMVTMIDVVFLLLVYFILTFENTDIHNEFRVQRPQSGTEAQRAPEPVFYQIEVLTRVGDATAPTYLVNGMGPLTEASLDQVLAQITPEESIAFLCAEDSVHEDLVTGMNACSRHGLSKIAVLSR